MKSKHLMVVALLATCGSSPAVGATVCGTVTDASTQLPVDRAGVFVRDLDGVYTGWYGASGPDGTYCIGGIVDGVYDFEFRRDDYLVGYVTRVVVGDPVSVDAALAPLPISLAARPNPASDQVRFALRVPAGAYARLYVLNAAGRVVRIWSGHVPDARYVDWDFTDTEGRQQPSGVYFVVLHSVGSRVSARVIRLE